MNGTWIRLTAADGHEFDAWEARPTGRMKAGLLVLQEIFGVNRHIRRVTEEFATRGYHAVAPALFDRVRPDAELGYDQLEAGRELMMALTLDQLTADLKAAIGRVRPAGKVGAVGYCWGGALVDLAACRTDLDAGAAYYGRAMVNWLEERPRCPVLYHFGRLDGLIPMEVVEQVRTARPGHEIHVYDEAGHGFNCEERPSYHAASASLALERTLAFFDQHLA